MATDVSSSPTAPVPEPIPFRGSLTITPDAHSAAVVVLKLAIVMETNDALDVALRAISAQQFRALKTPTITSAPGKLESGASGGARGSGRIVGRQAAASLGHQAH
jgi:hypothetical protein